MTTPDRAPGSPGRPELQVVFVAGPSGSGKSRLVRLSGCPCLRLDDFYLDADAPGLPRRHGIVHWDHPDTWDAPAAMTALRDLLRDGRTRVPEYSIPLSRRTGWRDLTLDPDARVLLVEGIFATEALPLCRADAIAATGIYLDRPALAVAWFRLKRDLKQRRKSVLVLLRRGLALWREQPSLRRSALAAGFTPLSLAEALAWLRSQVESEAPARRR